MCERPAKIIRRMMTAEALKTLKKADIFQTGISIHRASKRNLSAALKRLPIFRRL